MRLEQYKNLATFKLKQAVSKNLKIENSEFEDYKLTTLERKILCTYLENAIKNIENTKEYIGMLKSQRGEKNE